MKTITLVTPDTAADIIEIVPLDLSLDGRYLLYEFVAIVQGVQVPTLYLKDMDTGATQTVAGAGSDHAFFGETNLSQDGRFVVYTNLTLASDIVTTAISIFDRTTGTTRTVYSDSAPASQSHFLSDVRLSADNQSVFFTSSFSDLTGIPNNSGPDVSDLFQLNLQTGAIQRLLVAADVTGGFSISSGGRYLAITSGDTVTGFDIDRIDLSTGNIDVIAHTIGFEVSLSRDGRLAVFTTNAALLPEDTNGGDDVYLKDMTTGALQIVSTSATGAVGDGESVSGHISADGTKVVFETDASNIIPSATNPTGGVVVKDLATGVVDFLSDSALERFDASADAETVAVLTGQSLTADDTDNLKDIYRIHVTRPSLTIDRVNGNDFVNAAQAGATIISGTSDAIGKTVFLTLPDSGAHLSAVVQANGTWNAIIDTGGRPDGLFHIHAVVSDGLTTSTNRSFTIDRTPPDASILSVAGDDIINAQELAHASVAGSVLFKNPTGSGTETGTIVIGIQGGLTSTFPGVANSSVVPFDFTHNLNATGLADGMHTVVLTATDHAGNSVTVTHQVLVDTTPPPFVTINSVGGDDVIDSSDVLTAVPVEGVSGAPGDTIRLSIDGVAAGTAVVQADGTWHQALDFSTVSGNVHHVLATDSDSAGNNSSDTETVLYDFATQRVSSSANGGQAPGNVNGLGFSWPSVSGDGRYIVFMAARTGLVAGDQQSSSDHIYLKDTVTGEIKIISTASNGALGNNSSDYPSISADGNYVVFTGAASNLVAGDDQFHNNVFRYNRVTGVIELVDRAADGTLASGPNDAEVLNQPTPISADGRYVAITSRATNLIPGVNTVDQRIYLKDMQTGAISLVASNAGNASMSADGRFVVYTSDAISGGQPQVFVWDRTTGTTRLVAADANGVAANATSFGGVISPDGHLVAFESGATNLVNGQSAPTGGYIKNLVTGEVTFFGQISSNTGTLAGASFSADDRYLAYQTFDHNDGLRSISVRDLQTGTVRLITQGNDGNPDYAFPSFPVLSADGSVIVFQDDDSHLVPGDTNHLLDIFRIPLVTHTLSMATIAGDGVIGPAEAGLPIAVHGTSDLIGGSVHLLLDGGAVGAATVAADGTWSTTLSWPALTEGEHSMLATLTDGSGDVAHAGSIFSLASVTPVVNIIPAGTQVHAGQPTTITFAFNEDVAGFAAGDITVSGGTLGTLTTVNGHTYTAVFTAGAGSSTASLQVAAGAVTDLGGNSSAAASLTFGIAADGYLSGSFVFQDANGNGVYDDGEAGTTTDATGHFALSGGSGPLVLQGGLDTETLLAFSGVLAAPEGFGSVTPLTTLAYYVQKQAGGDASAMATLVNTLAHSGQDENAHDIVAEAGDGQLDAQNYLINSVQVADAVALMASALSGAGGVPYGQAYADVMQGLADAIVANGASTDLLAQVVPVMTQLGQTYGIATDVTQNISGVTNTIIHNIADALAQVPKGLDGAGFLTDLYGIARLAQGAASDVVGSPGAQTSDPFGAITAPFTGEALHTAIVAATAPLGVTPISLPALDTTYTQDFNTLDLLAGSHDLTIPGWLLSESGANADGKLTVDDGHSNVGDTYSYGSPASTDRALGTVQSGLLVPNFGAVFVNDTGATITSLDISYTGEEWRLGATGRNDSLTFEYSLDATDLNSGTWTSVHALDFSTPSALGPAGATDGNASGFHTSLAATINGLHLAAGATVFVRWRDTNVTGNNDGLAVDDFSLTPHSDEPATITVQTTGGIDLRFATLYNEIANSPIGAGGTSTQYTCIDSGAFNGQSTAIKFVVTGTGFTYSGSFPTIQLTGGTITGVQETDSTDNLLATFTGLSIDAVTFQTAMNTYTGGGANPSGLNALFLAKKYQVAGGAGLDRLQGGNLDDTFIGSTGNDTMNGGTGSNTADYSGLTTSGLFAIIQGGVGTVNKGGANGTDTLTVGIQSIVDNGSNRSDIFEVDAAENITANSANFNYLIELTAGVNLTYGANFTGITEFVSNTGTNTVNFAADTHFAYVFGSTGNDTLTLGSGGGYLIGEGGTNVLTGGASATNLFVGGLGGSDTMNGGAGTASNYYFVDGNDQVNGAGAFNAVIELASGVTVQVGSAQYQHVQEFVSNAGTNAVTVANTDSDFVYLYGGAGNDTLSTGTGGGYLIGEGGTNVLNGGGGLNVFVADGGAGADTMNGGSGSNIYFIDANSAVHGAGTFNTVIELQQNVSLMLGSAQLGNDVQQVVFNSGTNSADFHTATAQVFLYGGANNDTLFGGSGSDFLYGGLGTNTFTFGAGWGHDTIEDWTAGTNSQIDLTALAGLGVHGITDLTQTITAGNDVITSSHTGTNSITLLGVGSALTASSFHFA